MKCRGTLYDRDQLHLYHAHINECLNPFQPNVESTDELSFFDEIIIEGLQIDKNESELLFIPEYCRSNTLNSQVFTYYLNTPLLKNEFSCFLNVARVSATVIDKLNVTYCFVVSIALPEMIANTIGVKLEVWTGCDLRFQDIQKCTSTSTELRTVVETRNVCSYINEQHIFKKCPLNRFRIFL